eukprot:6926986-Prymnesium_polylepis.1
MFNCTEVVGGQSVSRSAREREACAVACRTHAHMHTTHQYTQPPPLRLCSGDPCSEPTSRGDRDSGIVYNFFSGGLQ